MAGFENDHQVRCWHQLQLFDWNLRLAYGYLVKKYLIIRTLTIQLGDKLADELKLESELVSIDEVEVIQKALPHYLYQRRMDRIRQEAKPYLEAAGFVTEEDIYREVLYLHA